MNVIHTSTGLAAEVVVVAVRELESWILSGQGYDLEVILRDQSLERTVDRGEPE